MKKTFYTIFPSLENVHLIKDVGMIPYCMSKLGYDSYIVGYGRDGDYPYLESLVKGLKLSKCRRMTKNDTFNGALYLLKHAKKIDVLNIYHYCYRSFVWILCYKLRNPKGKVYLKLDIDPTAGMKMKMKKNSVKWYATKWILGLCNVVSSETRYFQEYANKNWPLRIEHIPNGILSSDIQTDHPKKKYIMTVGRLGAKQKNVELLVEAFKKACLKISNEWTLFLVGSRTKEFDQYLESQYLQHPWLKKRINVVGIVEDRDQLDQLYKKCCIFTMPSRWESFGIAALEALARGDFLLLSDLIAFKEISFNEKYGSLFPVGNISVYVESIVRLCQRAEREELIKNKGELAQDLKNRYSWDMISKKIKQCLEDV